MCVTANGQQRQKKKKENMKQPPWCLKLGGVGIESWRKIVCMNERASEQQRLGEISHSCAYTRTSACIHTYACIQTHVRAHTQHARKHARTHTHARTHAHTHTHTLLPLRPATTTCPPSWLVLMALMEDPRSNEVVCFGKGWTAQGAENNAEAFPSTIHVSWQGV